MTDEPYRLIHIRETLARLRRRSQQRLGIVTFVVAAIVPTVIHWAGRLRDHREQTSREVAAMAAAGTEFVSLMGRCPAASERLLPGDAAMDSPIVLFCEDSHEGVAVVAALSPGPDGEYWSDDDVVSRSTIVRYAPAPRGSARSRP